MSNVIVNSIDFVKHANEKASDLLAQEKEQKMLTLDWQMQNILPKEIMDAFDHIERTRIGYKLYYKMQLTYMDFILHFTFNCNGDSTNLNLTCNLIFNAGAETITTIGIQLPPGSYKPLSEMCLEHEHLKRLQTENNTKFIQCIAGRIETLNNFKLSKPHYWATEIPRNFSGASKVPTLLEKLELDKVFLTQEQYDTTKTILLQVKADGEKFTKDMNDRNALWTEIVNREYHRWTEETNKYIEKLKELSYLYGRQFFKPWKVDSVTYMAEHIDPKDLYDEDGKLLEEIADAMTWTAHCLTEPSENGFQLIVDLYGSTRLRKISTNIVHTERLEFNEYPELGSNSNFWKKVYLDSSLPQIYFLVPPGTELKDLVIPAKPIGWTDASAALGVLDPWRYRVESKV